MDSADVLSFKTRVDRFWKWWVTESERLLATIDDARCGDLQPEVSEQASQLWPRAGWVFGPPPEGKQGHSFTLTAEGNPYKQFLTEYWRSQAPELEGWTFYSSRQPGDVHPDAALQFGEGLDFNFGGLWVTPSVQMEDECIDLVAWHPLFAEIDEDMRWRVLPIMLDEVLGEYGADQWLGGVEIGDGQLSGALPAIELRDFLHDLEVQHGWRKLPPTESLSLYECKEPDTSRPRGDVFVGATKLFQMIREWPLEEDPLDGSGADLFFIEFPAAILPKGEEADFRYALEDAVENKLGSDAVVLGGATGIESVYIDILSFDADGVLDRVMETLAAESLPSGTTLAYSAPGYEGRRRILP